MENELYIEVGEVKTSPTQKIVVFFTHILPTGAEQPLSYCKEIKKQWLHIEEQPNKKITRIKYNVLLPVKLKMITTIYGITNRLYPKTPKIFLYFTCDSSGDLIEVIGYKGVGKVRFRGYINYEKSSPEIKEEFEIKILETSKDNKQVKRRVLY